MESESITELMAILILQLGIILFAVRLFGRLVKKIGIPQVLGELIAGIVIGPYALGGIPLPGFSQGIFPLAPTSLAVNSELYGFAMVASVILLFASGLETKIKLFLRYSLAGSLISIGGVLASFAAGSFVGTLMYDAPFTDPRCLFIGSAITANSLGIIARYLTDYKKMDSPESVTIMAASVFDDVLAIISLTVVTGIFAVVSGNVQSAEGLNNGLLTSVLAIAGKAFGIWLGCFILGLVFSKKLASLLKLFGNSFDFSVLALGVALILAGLFEKQGLAMIIGAYIAGISLSRTDIAPVIQDRIHGIYDFFVPIFFAVTGMMVNIRDIIDPQVLVFGVIFGLAAVVAKLIGCGFPALLFGFNLKGALRIGMGMSPRGEMTLIIAGVGLALGILSSEIFAVLIFVILITTLISPPLLNAAFRMKGSSTRKPAKDDDSSSMTWKFFSDEVADLVVSTLLGDLRDEGFYVQVMSYEDGISHARKDNISLTIREEEKAVTIESASANMLFVKTAVFEVILELYESIQKLKETADPAAMKKELLDGGMMTYHHLLALINPECVTLNLKGETKEDIITELVDILALRGMLLNREMVIRDVIEREKAMTTGMVNGVALPHAKSDGTEDIKVAVGIKKEGLDFGSLDGKKSRLFILVVSSKKFSGPHLQFLSAISSVLENSAVCEAVLEAPTVDRVVGLLRAGKHKS